MGDLIDLQDRATTTADMDRPKKPVETSQTFQEYVFKYVTDWCASSRDYTKQKEGHWQRMRNLTDGTLRMSQWEQNLVSQDAGIEASRRSGNQRDWMSDSTMNPGDVIESYADKAAQMLFAQDSYVLVFSEDPRNSIEMQEPSTAQKIQQLLLNKLNEGQFPQRIAEGCAGSALMGTVFAKVFWRRQVVTTNQWQQDAFGKRVVMPQQRVVRECPVTHVIPLDRVLVDWMANDSDIQNWMGIGNRVDIPYWLALDYFDGGYLNLNRRTFEEKYYKGTSYKQTSSQYDELGTEAAQRMVTDRIPKVCLWEWYGQIPTNKGYHECCVTIATDINNQDNPEDGVLVRLHVGPLLSSGLRPFVTCQFTPHGYPFGTGILDSSLDLIYTISQIQNMILNNCRLTQNAILMYNPASPFGRKLEKDPNKNVMEPGAKWPVDDMNKDAKLVEFPFNAELAFKLLQDVRGEYQKRTNVSNITDPTTQKTHISASQVMDASQRADLPFNVRVRHFALSYLEQAARISLGMVQQFSSAENQVIMLMDQFGRQFPAELNQMELATGRYRVASAMLRQDQTMQTKMQSIQQLLPIVLNPESVMILQQHGIAINYAELLKRFAVYAGIEQAEKIVAQIPPQQPMMPGQAPPGLLPPGQGPPGGTPGQVPQPMGAQGGPMGGPPSQMNTQMLQTQEQARPYGQGNIG